MTRLDVPIPPPTPPTPRPSAAAPRAVGAERCGCPWRGGDARDREVAMGPRGSGRRGLRCLRGKCALAGARGACGAGPAAACVCLRRELLSF